MALDWCSVEKRERAFVVQFWLQWIQSTGSGGRRRGKYSAL